MNRDTWVATHPCLQAWAEMDALVEISLAAIDVPLAPVPSWDAYAADFDAGVPLVESPNAAIDLAPPEEAVLRLIRQLAASPSPSPLATQCQVMERELGGASAAEPFAPTHAGLFSRLASVVLARYLSPVVSAFDTWRNEERWLRNYCPTCGERPAMAQLTGREPDRLRKLSCGRCQTRWRYRATGCPFCERQNDRPLALGGPDDEAGLRIDYCVACGGYLKTYDGEGMESLLLADWTSLHLDLLARDRGLKRTAASLYELEPSGQPI